VLLDFQKLRRHSADPEVLFGNHRLHPSDSVGQQRHRSGWDSTNEVQRRIDGDLIRGSKAVPILETHFPADHLRCVCALSGASVNGVLAKRAPEILSVGRPVLELTQQ
jgi:hypothetical protein